MSAGEKFEVTFDDDAVGENANEEHSPFSFVGDILERQPTSAAPPSEPRLKNKTGFPAHAKRSITSRFKQKQQDERQAAVPAAESVDSSAMTERQQIDKENKDRLAAMSTAEIAEARQELLNSLKPDLLQRILRQADISSGSNEAVDLKQPDAMSVKDSTAEIVNTSQKKVKFIEESDTYEEQETLPHDSIHFPRPPQPPDLNPESESFLEDLHNKYFPSLPSEPEKLEWMRTSNGKNSYDPGQSALNPGDIRFDFKGTLLPPSLAAQIPVSEGLHHHADAPDAAGYTIPELAHLSRSTYAPQRCIAFQTLGRILFKLGKGEFGNPGEAGGNAVGAEDTMGELARGLWREIESQKVIEQLVAESEGNGIDGGRHLSAKAYAVEAVWLWRKGGGRRWKAD